MGSSIRINNSDDLAWFQRSGLLWFVNRILHPFGFAIAIQRDSETLIATGVVLQCTNDSEGITFSDENNLESQKHFIQTFDTIRQWYE